MSAPGSEMRSLERIKPLLHLKPRIPPYPHEPKYDLTILSASRTKIIYTTHLHIYSVY